jgi:outer membrane protein assembly factor BamB
MDHLTVSTTFRLPCRSKPVTTAFTWALAVAMTLSATANPRTARREQTSSLPSGTLTFGAFTAQFRADGTFSAEASIEGLGVLRTTSQWKAERDIVELTGWNMSKGFEFLGPSALAGCEIPGRYRYAMDGAHVRFERLADDCEARRILFDGSRWRPAGTPEIFPERRIVRAPAKPMPRLPRATDPAGSWPSFRGSQASGVADGQHLPDRWNGETGEHILWRTPIAGLAHSSPIVWDDRLFVTSAIGSRGDATSKPGQYGDRNDRSRHRWMLYALDRHTGKILWERTVHQGEPIDRLHVKSTYASASPATDGRIVIAWFGSHGVHAYTVTGDFLWKVDLGRVDAGATGFPMVEWGPASSPIIWNDLVILQVDTQADSFVVALALESGELVWKTTRDEVSSWSTPTVLSTAAGPELVTNASKYVRGYDPRTGDERWRLRGGGGSIIPVPTPVLGDGLLVIASSGVAGTRPLFVVRPGARGDLSLKESETSNAAVVWSRMQRGSFIPTPLAYRGLLYVLGNNGVLDAYDLKSGEEIYRQRLPEIGSGFSASPVAADGKIYLVNEDGQVVVVSAGREFRHLATNTIGEPMMATPALSGGVMYARGARSVMAIGSNR